MLDISYSDHVHIKFKNVNKSYAFHILGKKIRHLTPSDIYCIYCIQVNVLLMQTLDQMFNVFHILVKILFTGKSSKRHSHFIKNTKNHKYQKGQKSS